MPKQFPIWKTLQIGGKSKDQLIVEMVAKRIDIDHAARDMLDSSAFTTAPAPIEVALVRLTVADLGNKKWPARKNLWKRARDRDLQLCPAEVAPHLLLTDAGLASGEHCWIAMEPIDWPWCAAGLHPKVFLVIHGERGERQLDRGSADEHIRWDPSCQFIFIAPGA